MPAEGEGMLDVLEEEKAHRCYRLPGRSCRT